MAAPLAFDLLVTAPYMATMADDGYGIWHAGAVGIIGEHIAWVGPQKHLPAHSALRHLDITQGWLLPGLVDCHTHLVYAGNRADEFEQRLQGASYADIARGGGGIMATVRATRMASIEQLVAESAPRLAALASEGVTTVEIKSGYGMDAEHELKQLAAAAALGSRCDVDVRTTLLGAHALPPEYAGRADDYIEYVCGHTLPSAANDSSLSAVNTELANDSESALSDLGGNSSVRSSISRSIISPPLRQAQCTSEIPARRANRNRTAQLHVPAPARGRCRRRAR